jgi:hypothetical protein
MVICDVHPGSAFRLSACGLSACLPAVCLPVACLPVACLLSPVFLKITLNVIMSPVGEMRTLTVWRNHYDGTFLGFYVVSFVQNLGCNSVTPSDVPETAQIKNFEIVISSNQEFRWAFLGLVGPLFWLLQKIQINFSEFPKIKSSPKSLFWISWKNA